jgi:hypothetical protein
MDRSGASGGAVFLIDSQVNSIYNYGAIPTSMGPAGHGGYTKLTNSNVSNIISYGGNCIFAYAGNGGIIELFNSTFSNISAYGGNVSGFSSGYLGGRGGTVKLHDNLINISYTTININFIFFNYTISFMYMTKNYPFKFFQFLNSDI